MLDSLSAMNRKHFKDVNDPEISARVAQYEMAFRMQTSVPELTDISKEDKKTLNSMALMYIKRDFCRFLSPGKKNGERCSYGSNFPSRLGSAL